MAVLVLVVAGSIVLGTGVVVVQSINTYLEVTKKARAKR